MGRIGVCVALGLTLVGIAGADDPEIARLKAQVERLEAENKALKSDAEARVGLARLGLDVRLLHRLQEAMREKPDDRSLRTDAADLARRIAPHAKGNRTVWQAARYEGSGGRHDGGAGREAARPRHREVARAARLVLQPEPSAPCCALPGGQDHGERAGRLEADQPVIR